MAKPVCGVSKRVILSVHCKITIALFLALLTDIICNFAVMRTRVIHLKRKRMPGGFYAINLCGIVIAAGPLNAAELNHERIHTAQMVELGFVGFYLWYVVEWLWLFMRYRNWLKAYFGIRFEREAYRHQGDMGYLKRRKHYRYNVER